MPAEGGDAMPWYRLYSIDSDGAIDSVEEFSARDDVEAVRISRGSARLRPRRALVPLANRRGARAPAPGEERMTGMNARSAPAAKPRRSSRNPVS
jgi:hypothetical protein